ncbi:hypothetical protein MLD38_000926 [Melastoma candidum]|uniref:Uncharacterized protein n=1 Tax=Melastoma candidum TaxID=119954 RepID=A0ACB9SC24_9MYRT|nr:hypothetical protein MLD38_000926 [Melastoma candidum]
MVETEQPPPSPATSPPREFSFEPSFVTRQEKSWTPDKPFAIDLSPADDIFFHGHLLPLRLLSNLQSSVTPRDSSASFTLPSSADDDPVFDNHRIQVPGPTKSAAISQSGIRADADDDSGARQKHKSVKSFSLFGLQRRKAAEGEEDAEHEKQSKRRIRFDIGQVRQAFKTMVKPFSLFRSRTEDDVSYGSCRRKTNDPRHSWGNIATKENWRQEVMRRGRYASAPASMRASPTNSGILVADIPSPKAASDSTIEELQAAIQAAILHCKNSIAKEEMKLTA